MPGQWPRDFHRLDDTGFEVIITHSLSRVCLIFLVPHFPIRNIIRVMQTRRGVKQGTEASRGRGRFKTAQSSRWAFCSFLGSLE